MSQAKSPSRKSIEKQIALFALHDQTLFSKLLMFVRAPDINNETYSQIFEMQKEQYEKHGKLHDKKFLIETIKEQRESQDLPIDDLLEMAVREPAYDSQKHIFDSALTLIYKVRILNAVSEITDMLDEESFKPEEVAQKINEAVAVNYDADLGMSIFDFERRMNELAKITSSAVPSFSDNLNHVISGGRFAGELYVYMGPPGIGKSLFLINDAYRALVKGFKVVYFTLELSYQRVGLRLDCLHSRQTQEEIFKNKQAVKDKYSLLRHTTKGDLIIKQYPTRGASVLDLKIFLEQKKMYDKFVPDLICVDYGDILKPMRDRDNEYSEKGEIFEALRGLAEELNVPVITATQSTREAIGKVASKVNMGQTSGSMTIPRIADAMYAIVQSEEEREKEYINLKIIKNRNGNINTIIPFRVFFSRMRLEDSEKALKST